jgi:hypothetical protein
MLFDAHFAYYRRLEAFKEEHLKKNLRRIQKDV